MSKINYLYNPKEGDISKFLLKSFRCIGDKNKSNGNIVLS